MNENVAVDSAVAEQARELLEERYGERARPVVEELERWLSGDVAYAQPEVLAKHVEEGKAALLYDAFWQILPFGTGGRRGPVGYGPNRLNRATVALTIQGHCKFLKESFPDEDLNVVVANDVRIFKDIRRQYGFLGDGHPLDGVRSRDFAYFAAEIYAGNGVTAYLARPDDDGAVLTTPELSFAITHLGALGGVNFSASHNPPDDNGAKVYDRLGAQPVPPDDQALADLMEDAPSIEWMDFADAREEGLIQAIPDELHEQYKRIYVERYDKAVERPKDDVRIVYTPLCGCGMTTVGEVLRDLGFPLDWPADQEADGTFAPIPFLAPNPEVPQATTPAREYADERGAEIVISSDPDADRVGVDVKVDGRWVHLTGNQIAAILTYFLMLDPDGPKMRGIVIETTVTTKLVGEIARQAGEERVIDDLLVGFKYVANVLARLEEDGDYRGVKGEQDDLVIAAEESHGIMVEPTIREKDATPAAMYLAALHQRLRREGSDLHAYFEQVVEQVGGYAETARSILAAGDEGEEMIKQIMESVREDPPDEVGGRAVDDVRDYLRDDDALGPPKSDTDRLSRNVVQVSGQGFVLTIRPSGTEPKLKFYAHALPEGGEETHAEAERRAEDIATTAYNELLERAPDSKPLSRAALLLPDIIQLAEKRRFDESTIPGLLAAIEDGGAGSLDDALGRLKEESADMTPGADPLPAIKAAVAAALDEADASGGVADELRRWASD